MEIQGTTKPLDILTSCSCWKLANILVSIYVGRQTCVTKREIRPMLLSLNQLRLSKIKPTAIINITVITPFKACKIISIASPPKPALIKITEAQASVIKINAFLFLLLPTCASSSQSSPACQSRAKFRTRSS